jgi:hypothetical protein
VVTKAKKAASSLHLILHAQSCRSPSCPHRGCRSTRLVLLHLASCAVGPGFSCASPGCDQARKLLSHYRRCRDLRLRATPDRPHNCLVCSLLAREVRAKPAGGPGPGEAGKEGRSRAEQIRAEHILTTVTSSMPPPPPRAPAGRGAAAPPQSTPPPPPPPNDLGYGSPTIPAAMLRKMSKVASAVRPASGPASPGLGKSVDSSGVGGLKQRAREEGSSSEEDGGDDGGDGAAAEAEGRRRREKRERSVSAGDAFDAVRSPARTVTKKSAGDSPENAAYDSWTSGPPAPAARNRSSSCGVLASMIRGGNFATIPEGREDDESGAGSELGSSAGSGGGDFGLGGRLRVGEGEDMEE